MLELQGNLVAPSNLIGGLRDGVFTIPCEKALADRGDQFCRMAVWNPFHNFFLEYFFLRKGTNYWLKWALERPQETLDIAPNVVDRYCIIRDNGWDKQHIYKFAKF